MIIIIITINTYIGPFSTTWGPFTVMRSPYRGEFGVVCAGSARMRSTVTTVDGCVTIPYVVYTPQCSDGPMYQRRPYSTSCRYRYHSITCSFYSQIDRLQLCCIVLYNCIINCIFIVLLSFLCVALCHKILYVAQ